MPKIEYKLFKTKSKLSSLLFTLGVNQAVASQPTQSQESFYILVEFNKNSKLHNESSEKSDDDGLDSIWFNRSNGQMHFKKSKILFEFM